MSVRPNYYYYFLISISYKIANLNSQQTGATKENRYCYCQLQPIENDKAPTSWTWQSLKATVKCSCPILQGSKVRGRLCSQQVRWPLFWPRRPARFISLMMAHYIREAEQRARAKQTITNRGAVAKIWCCSQWKWGDKEGERGGERGGERERERGGNKRTEEEQRI